MGTSEMISYNCKREHIGKKLGGRLLGQCPFKDDNPKINAHRYAIFTAEISSF